MSQQERSHLARQQAAALGDIFSGSAETGIGRADLERTADVLLRKRRREAALAAPRLAAALGEQFQASFETYAGKCRYVRGGPQADAAAFGVHLQREMKLPAAAMVENLRLRALTGGRFQWGAVQGRRVLVMRLGRLWVFEF